MIGVLGLGAALTAAGALGGGFAVRAGAFAGLSALAIPTLLWGSWFAAVAILLIALAVSQHQQTGLTDRLAAGLRAHRTALGFLAPAGVAMLVLVATPFLLGLVLGFFDLNQGTWSFVGLHNFVEILSGNSRALDDPLNFWGARGGAGRGAAGGGARRG